MPGAEPSPTSTEISTAIARLEAESDIRHLVARYAELCDQAYEPDGLAALFTEDATWSSRSKDGTVDFGQYRGREQIRRFFAGASADLGPTTLHYLLTPRIEVAPDLLTATGHWYLYAILDQRPAGSEPGSPERERVVLGGSYSHDYRKLDGSWLISRLACDIVLESPFPS